MCTIHADKPTCSGWWSVRAALQLGSLSITVSGHKTCCVCWGSVGFALFEGLASDASRGIHVGMGLVDPGIVKTGLAAFGRSDVLVLLASTQRVLCISTTTHTVYMPECLAC